VLGFGVITLIASFFGVVNTQYISVLERTREIGLMKALGMSRRSVSLLFIIEATWIGFLGALLGSVLAVVAGSLLNPWISRKLSFGGEHLLIFKPSQIILLIAFLMLITTVAGLLPARKASRLDPIEALRTD
jgi:putative ABC transport system permease protein